MFPANLDAGNLNAKYDVLIFVEGAIPGATGGSRGGGGSGSAAPINNVPPEYQAHQGRVTVERTLPQIKSFIENGGTVIALGSSAANLSSYLQLPIENHLVENGTPLPRTKFYVPGSVLSARVDVTNPLAHGMAENTYIFFDNSPVFKLGANAKASGVKVIAWFDGKSPLRSGWAWGQQYLDGGVAAIEAPLGKGNSFFWSGDLKTLPTARHIQVSLQCHLQQRRRRQIVDRAPLTSKLTRIEVVGQFEFRVQALACSFSRHEREKQAKA